MNMEVVNNENDLYECNCEFDYLVIDTNTGHIIFGAFSKEECDNYIRDFPKD